MVWQLAGWGAVSSAVGRVCRGRCAGGVFADGGRVPVNRHLRRFVYHTLTKPLYITPRSASQGTHGRDAHGTRNAWKCRKLDDPAGLPKYTQPWNKSSRPPSSTSSSHDPPHRSRSKLSSGRALAMPRGRRGSHRKRPASSSAAPREAPPGPRFLSTGRRARRRGRPPRAHTRLRAARDHPSLAQHPSTVLCPLACVCCAPPHLTRGRQHRRARRSRTSARG